MVTNGTRIDIRGYINGDERKFICESVNEKELRKLAAAA